MPGEASLALVYSARMKRLLALALVLGTTHAALAKAKPATAPAALPVAVAPLPPVAKRVPHPQLIGGRTFADDYYWLRQKGTPEVEGYLKAENAYTDAVMKPTEPFQAALYREMLARIQETDVTVPHRVRGYYYYGRTQEGQQYPIRCRKRAAGAAKDDLTGATATAPEEILLDQNELAKGEKFVAISAFNVSDDGNWLAYSVDTTGFRQFTLVFKDLKTGALSAERIPRVDAVEWAPDHRTVFYVVEDAVAKRPYRLYRHRVGTDPGKDALVYEEKDERFDLNVSRSLAGDYLFATSESKITSEVRMLATKHPDAAWTVVEPRQEQIKYDVLARGRDLFILTNAPAKAGEPIAVNFRVATTSVDKPGRAHWQSLIPHRAEVRIEAIEVFSDHAILHERADALPRLSVLSLDGKRTATPIAMPEALYAVFGEANAEYETTNYRFAYQSPVTPLTIYDYDLKSRKLTLRKRVEVKGYDASRYTTKRIAAVAKDGARIPISLVYKVGIDANPASPPPMLLYGYGSYGLSMPLMFSPERFSLLDRGVVFAIAHIRGGGDMGKPWHEAGRMANKMNTFTDFIACGEELERLGWTARDRVIINGGSAGGLLMGAVTNLRPDLWKGVVAQVPFVDVINTMFDETLPLTVGEFEEWGNPKKPDELAVMAAYSPYDNVKAQAYPAMLVESSYNDSQVMYWEPAKWVAKLRALKTDKAPLLLHLNMEPAGHGGTSGRYDRLHETAFRYAWILNVLGIKQ